MSLRRVAQETQLELFEGALLYVSQADAAAALGLTTRMIQYWETQGLIHPELPLEGRHRRYTRRDLVELHFIKALVVDCGYSVPSLKEKLIGLRPPYDYDPEEVFWDLRVRAWRSRRELACDELQRCRELILDRLQRFLAQDAAETAPRVAEIALDLVRDGLEGKLAKTPRRGRGRPRKA